MHFQWYYLSGDWLAQFQRALLVQLTSYSRVHRKIGLGLLFWKFGIGFSTRIKIEEGDQIKGTRSHAIAH